MRGPLGLFSESVTGLKECCFGIFEGLEWERGCNMSASADSTQITFEEVG